VVGDDQQLIYGWRYASIELFLGFEKDWPGTRVVTLDENYRSTANIIAAASTLIAHNRKQKPKTLHTKNPRGNPIRLIEAGDEDEEAEWIAEQIANGEGQRTKKTDDGPYALGHLPSTAVLYRTNAQSRPRAGLIEQGSPASTAGPSSMNGEIKDLSRRWLSANPRDEISRERLTRHFQNTYPGVAPATPECRAIRLIGQVLERTTI
jgi:DNA helicase-2/ATP-dependent DNA helicase PcrA